MKKRKSETSDDTSSLPKLKKVEVFTVEGTNWKVGVTIDTTEFHNCDDMMIECATRGVEYAYYSDPKNFKLAPYIQVVLTKKKPYLKWVNSYTALTNASLFSKANMLKTNIFSARKVDIEKEKKVI